MHALPPLSPGQFPEAGRHRRRRIAVSLTVLVLAVAVTGGAVYFSGDDERTAAAKTEFRAFLDSWAAGKAGDAARHTDRPPAAESLLASVGRGLRPRHTTFDIGDEVRESGRNTLNVPFTAHFSLPGMGTTWSYTSRAQLRSAGGAWRVHWQPSLIHPRLDRKSTLVLSHDQGRRGSVRGAQGSELAGEGKVWDVGVWPRKLRDPERAYRALADPALGADVDVSRLRKRVDAAGKDESVPVVTLRDAVYQRNKHKLLEVAGLQFREAQRPVARSAKSTVGTVDDSGKGVSGLQRRYEHRLAGDRSARVETADRITGRAGRTLVRSGSTRAGKPVRTTISPTVQSAAQRALSGLRKNASLVAVKPSNGSVLAVADRPESGENRALTGRYPPGSTFKMVTSSALVADGVRAGQRVHCPKYTSVAGQRFENQDEFDLPSGSTFRQAFARSCNTAFVGLRTRLAGDTLHRTAATFGIGSPWQVGAATFDGSVPVSRSANDTAATAIGQGRVESSPLVMASVAATVDAGTFHQPVLVPDAVHHRHRAPAKPDTSTVRELRSMMRSVVTSGSGTALRGLPGEPHAKTGTAEFGKRNPPRTHAWMAGYLGKGDLAFCVFVEDGGSGGKDAGPVAKRFLNGLR